MGKRSGAKAWHLEKAVKKFLCLPKLAVARFASLIGEEQASDLLNTTVVATIGPVTAAAATELGIKNPLIADTYTVDGLVEALIERFAGVRT